MLRYKRGMSSNGHASGEKRLGKSDIIVALRAKVKVADGSVIKGQFPSRLPSEVRSESTFVVVGAVAVF